MKAIAAYMASKSTGEREHRPNERIDTHDKEYRSTEHDERNRMGEDFPESNEMRRRRDSRGRYMNVEEMDARSYDARNEYMPQRSEYGRVENRVIPDYPIVSPMDNRAGLYDGGGIGFGTRGEPRSHYDEGKERIESAEVGGSLWMKPKHNEANEPMMMDKETAEEWVNNMRNEDKNHPHGGKWSPESLKPFAQKYNIPTDGKKFWEFYAITNAMYSDYSEVGKKFGITSPEFYVCLAKAFIDDRDAEPDKVARYYEYIAKK